MKLSDFDSINDFLDAAITTHYLTPDRSHEINVAFFNAVAKDAIQGLVLEFGVARGETLRYIADAFPNQTVYGFDWFQGLPEDWRPGLPKGTFACGIPEVRDNNELVVGLFEDVLPKFMAEHAGETASFVHLDADLYSSTVTILNNIESRLAKGTILLFDEFVYPEPGDYREHEYKAFKEFLERTNLNVEYYGTRGHDTVGFRII